MKVICIKNYKPGFFGFDFRDKFVEGDTYTVYFSYYTIYAYVPFIQKWFEICRMDFNEMFKPTE